MENSKLMTPLFYDGMFNRDGRRMRAVLERKFPMAHRLTGCGVPPEHRTWTTPAPRMTSTSSMWRSTAILHPST